MSNLNCVIFLLVVKEKNNITSCDSHSKDLDKAIMTHPPNKYKLLNGLGVYLINLCFIMLCSVYQFCSLL